MNKQHLIDPEVCIRCNTCEETCPVHAVAHDDNNYAVQAEVCQGCMQCIQPCPTGAINNWRVVAEPYALAQQFSWKELPPPGSAECAPSDARVEALEDEVSAVIDEAHKGYGGRPRPPASAGKPTVNLYNRARPARAAVIGNFRLTGPDAEHDIRHIILDFGTGTLPVLEGQSLGIIPPGTDAQGAPHRVRLYSIASPRDGEKPNSNYVAFTVKRVPGGICSNYFCDLPKGATVEVTGPFGSTFLMPDDPAASIMMICTGTGSAPFRGFIARRGRSMPKAAGHLTLFFGARCPEELPYFGPLQKLPERFLTRHMCFSRVVDQPKNYVQDTIRKQGAAAAAMLADPSTHLFICGLKAMENGLDAAFSDTCKGANLSWPALRADMQGSGRFQIETY